MMARTCYCQGYCRRRSAYNGTCQLQEEGKCFSQVEILRERGVLKEVRTWGCLNSFSAALFQCSYFSSVDGLHKHIMCCKDSNLCNKKLYPELLVDRQATLTSDTVGIISMELLLTIIIPTIVGLMLICILGCCLFRTKLKTLLKDPSPKNGESSPEENPGSEGSGSLSGSGSGGGMATLRQVTVALEIKIKGSLGKGRYGEVLLGERKGELVAVKFFSAQDENSWLQEKDIYEEIRTSHNKNILGFKAADIMWSGNETKMLLVTEYHELGSLHDFLKKRPVTLHSTFRMCHSIISGLFYLHENISAHTRKSAIAHRDLKTKNILIKTRRGDCCIADFGLAVKQVGDQSMDVGSNPRVGTKRYMAPEVLEKNIDMKWIDSFKRVDIYSFSLVLWEICLCLDLFRTDRHSETGEHRLPYHDSVSFNPSFDEMCEVVCAKKIRPKIPDCWRKHQVMEEIARIIEECWRSQPNARLTALRIKKDLIELNRKCEMLKLKLD